jgi:peptidoglycan L-alanyl-D-glutamate endopeptidase CwlK
MNKNSREKLATCHPNIIRLAIAVNNIYPIQCICGHRNELDQEKAFQNGFSKLKYPDSKHNKKPSLAADFVPDPDKNSKTLDWNDIEEFERMCLVFEQVADDMDIKIRLGRDFKFVDFPHCELRT